LSANCPCVSWSTETLRIPGSLAHPVSSIRNFFKALLEAGLAKQNVDFTKFGKKSYKAIKKIGCKERRIINDILHKISRTIVSEALENDSMIVLGDLKGIRRNGRGRAFNRKLNNGFPYHRLSQFIEYKARWHGIKVVKISERDTSKTCHRCGRGGFESEASLSAQTAATYATQTTTVP